MNGAPTEINIHAKTKADLGNNNNGLIQLVKFFCFCCCCCCHNSKTNPRRQHIYDNVWGCNSGSSKQLEGVKLYFVFEQQNLGCCTERKDGLGYFFYFFLILVLLFFVGIIIA